MDWIVLCDCSSVIDVPVTNNKSEPKPAFIKSKWEEVDENQLAQQGAFTRSVTILQTCTIVLNVNKSNRTGDVQMWSRVILYSTCSGDDV